LKNYNKEFSVDGVEDSTVINFPIYFLPEEDERNARGLQDKS
jgi:hypothetical protein